MLQASPRNLCVLASRQLVVFRDSAHHQDAEVAEKTSDPTG